MSSDGMVGEDLLFEMLGATAFVVESAARSLTAEDVAAEKTDSWIRNFLAGRGTLAFDCQLCQCIIGLWQTNELENCWVSNFCARW